MCTDSLHVKNRFATDKEDLTVTYDPTGRYIGLYPVNDPTTMVCFVRHTKAIMSKIDFGRSVAPSSTIRAWAGKDNVEVTLLGRRYEYLMVEMPDGQKCHLGYMLGTQVRVGMPVTTGVDGMKAVERALDEQQRTPEPVPAPAIVATLALLSMFAVSLVHHIASVV